MLRHVQRSHFEPVVAAVFKNHAVELFLLGEIYQFPTFFQVHSRWHLVSHILAVFESALCYNGVVVPVGSDVHEVDIVASA